MNELIAALVKANLLIVSILLFSTTFPEPLKAQLFHYDHGFTIGDGLMERANAMAVDKKGNVYLAGHFASDSIDIDPSNGTNYVERDTGNPYNSDLFLIKLDRSGSFIWGQSWSVSDDHKFFKGYSNGVDEITSPTNIAIDEKNGAIYLSSYTIDSIDINPGPGVQYTKGVNNNSILVKLDSNGRFLWGRSNQHVKPRDIAIDKSGNILLVGTYDQSVDLDPNRTNDSLKMKANFYGSLGFVAKYDGSGHIMWANGIGVHQSTAYPNQANRLAIGMNNEIILAGRYHKNIALDFANPNDVTLKTSSNGSSTFISLYDSTGAFQWAKSFNTSGFSNSTALHCTPTGQIYLAGAFNGILESDPPFNRVFCQGKDDAFMARFDMKGNMFWRNALGSRNGFDYILSLKNDTNGYIYFTGRMGSGIDFEPGPNQNILTTQDEDIPIVKIDSNYSLISLQSLAGSGVDIGINLHIGDDKIYLSGAFEKDLFMSPDKTQKVTSRGDFDIFYANLDFCDKQIIPDNTILSAIVSSCPVDSLAPPKARNGCAGELIATTTTQFPIKKKGRTTIIWKYVDFLGNTFSQTQEVSINDNIAPNPNVIVLPEVVSFCPIQQWQIDTPKATDNCIGEIAGIPNVTFPITTSTTLSWTYRDSVGNTTTQTQDVIIANFDTSYTVIDNRIAANQTGVSYQWLDCNSNFRLIPGATNATFTPTTNGSYAVELRDGNCTERLKCQNVTLSTGVEEVSHNKWMFYPNPTTGLIHFTGISTRTHVSILTITGKVLFEGVVLKENPTVTLPSSLAKGSYLLQLKSSSESMTRMLLIE